MKQFTIIAALILGLAGCICVLAVCAACVFTTAVEARRDLERKETAEKLIEATNRVADKMPDFTLFNRGVHGEQHRGGSHEVHTRFPFGRVRVIER